MKRGRKSLSPETKKARGETRPSQKVEVLFPDHASRPDPENFPPPKWLSGTAKKIWQEKVERYRQRGQKIDGFQDSLAQYCSLESELIDDFRKKKIVPPMAMVAAHRMWAAEFYDTPSSHNVPTGGNKKAENKFTKNGNRSQS